MPAGYNPLTFRLGRVSDDGRVVPGTAGSTPVVWREQGGWTRHALQVPNGYEGATTELAFDDGTVVGYARDDIGFGLYDRYPLMWAFVDGGTIAATLLEGREGELDKVMRRSPSVRTRSRGPSSTTWARSTSGSGGGRTRPGA